MERTECYYIDTSIIGGCFDREFKQASNVLVDLLMTGTKLAMVSDLTEAEISNAPKAVRDRYDEIPGSNKRKVFVTDESLSLANEYIRNKVISGKFIADAQHIAVATVNRADVIVSWNFKHIVNLERIRGYNSVNINNGYGLMEIRSPWEVVGHGR